MESTSPAAERSTHRWLAFSLIAAVAFVLILDAAIVNVALPSIGNDLNVERDQLSWVTNGYLLAFGGFLLLGGRLSDLFGRRRLFIVGLALFTLASLAGALAQSVGQLVAARAVQGFGAALVTPAALALVMVLFAPGPERNKALGLWGAVAGSGAAAGSILGGVLTEWFGWEAVLWVNVPIGIVAIALAPRLLPAARDESEHRAFDLAGAATITGGLGLLVYTLVEANDAGWVSTQTIGLGALSVALIAAFVVIEARSARPLVPLGIFRTKSLRSGNIIAVLTTLTMFPMFFILSLYLQDVLDMEPIEAGLGQLPIALMFVFLAGVVSRIVTRVGYKIPLVFGIFAISAGLLWLSRLEADSTWLGSVLGPAIVVGIGGAFSFIPTTIAATAEVDPHESGLASGLINTSQQIGGALGLAIATAVATASTESSVEGGELNPLAAVTDGYRAALVVGAAIAFAAAWLAIAIIPGKRKGGRAGESDSQPELTPAADGDRAADREPVTVGF